MSETEQEHGAAAEPAPAETPVTVHPKYNWRNHLTPFWQDFWAKMDRKAAGLAEEPGEVVNDERLAHWLERTGHSIRRRIEREVLPLGLGASQAALLLELAQHRHPTHELCARRMRLSRAVVTRLLANLKTLGLVEVLHFETDRRVQVPKLTELGLETLDTLRQALWKVEDAIGRDLTPDERALLKTLLARVDATIRSS